MHPYDRALIKDLATLATWCALVWFGSVVVISSTYPEQARFVFYTGAAYAEEAREGTTMAERVDNVYPCKESRAPEPLRCP